MYEHEIIEQALEKGRFKDGLKTRIRIADRDIDELKAIHHNISDLLTSLEQSTRKADRLKIIEQIKTDLQEITLLEYDLARSANIYIPFDGEAIVRALS